MDRPDPEPTPTPHARALGERIRAVLRDLRLPGALPSNPREKIVVTSILFAYCFGGYYAVGLTFDPSRAATLHTALDDAIPFNSWFMWAYEAVYTALLFPLFTVRCQRLFRRTALAYLLVIGGCLATWVVYPVSAVSLRADVRLLDPTVFHEWGLLTNYALDPPLNCFPSLHLAIATLAGLVAWRARRLYGVFGLSGAALVAVAICAVKQHYVLDGVAGALLAAGVWAAVVRGYDPGDAPPEQVAYSWRGPAAYVAVHLGVLLALLVLFALGWRAWE